MQAADEYRQGRRSRSIARPAIASAAWRSASEDMKWRNKGLANGFRTSCRHRAKYIESCRNLHHRYIDLIAQAITVPPLR